MYWEQYGANGRTSNFLKTMTRADMPAIQTIGLHGNETEDTDILELLESKKTLKTIDIYWFPKNVFPYSFWHQLLGILKKPCTPKRPILNIINYELGKEAVSKIPCNRLK